MQKATKSYLAFLRCLAQRPFFQLPHAVFQTPPWRQIALHNAAVTDARRAHVILEGVAGIMRAIPCNSRIQNRRDEGNCRLGFFCYSSFRLLECCTRRLLCFIFLSWNSQGA